MASEISEAARVFRSSGNSLYLTGGSNAAASLHTAAGFESRVDCAAWDELLARRRDAVAASGASFAQLIVPEKLAVYPLEGADRALVFPGLSAAEVVAPGRRLLERINAQSIIYPDEFLRQQTGTLPMFQPTDSHWTWQGAFSAFQVLMAWLDFHPDYDDFVHLPKRQLRYRGDLWEPRFDDIEPDPFERIILPAGVRRIYANPMMGLKERLGLPDEAGLHVGSHCIFHNDQAAFKETVVLFGSSFSECRLEPSLLTSVFAFYFSTVHFVWSNSVDAQYVERHRPAITIAEIPERFLTALPADGVGVEDYAVERVRAWQAKHD
jgi:hypothetical protein